MDESELGQRAHALPQFICFWWIWSGKVKNFRTGLVQDHRRSPKSEYTVPIGFFACHTLFHHLADIR
jgi:hypothetical protein